MYQASKSFYLANVARMVIIGLANISQGYGKSRHVGLAFIIHSF